MEASESVATHMQLCQQQLKQVLLWLAGLFCVMGIVFFVESSALVPPTLATELSYVADILVTAVLIVLAFRSWQFIRSKRYLADYRRMHTTLKAASYGSSINKISASMNEAADQARTNNLISQLHAHYKPILSSRITELHRQSLMNDLQNEYASLQTSCKSQLNEKFQQLPLLATRDQIAASLAFLTRRRHEMTKQWEAAYANFSWWNQFKYSTGPDFSEIDNAINELKVLQRKLESKHSGDIKILERHFSRLEQTALSRLSYSKTAAEQYINECRYEDNLNSGLLTKAFWLAAMSVPISAWSDLHDATNVYSALRGVNSNFADMSNMEIWWESLFLSTESLAGLAALTKGAYFEQLVASDTGGQLFEHFNHPDTDIVIDGIAFQLKATDNAGYVYSVDESIPVIATSEVALTTGTIDSGYSNEALTTTVDNALGGTILDVGDTTVDAILTGLGGLGFFATVGGINHAAKKYENGGDGVEAVFEGAGVAIEGTARALFGTAEMSYKILSSRPSRFVGRAILSGLNKLDQKLTGAPENK